MRSSTNNSLKLTEIDDLFFLFIYVCENQAQNYLLIATSHHITNKYFHYVSIYLRFASIEFKSFSLFNSISI